MGEGREFLELIVERIYHVARLLNDYMNISGNEEEKNRSEIF